MSDDIDALLTKQAGDAGDDIDALLSARASSTAPASTFHVPTEQERQQLADWNKQPQGSKWYERAAAGVLDPAIGAGQLLQNIPGVGAGIEKGREAISAASNWLGEKLSGAPHLPDEYKQTSTDDFNAMVRRREQYYQADRAAAGKTGMDWTRLGGTLANPVSWMAPGSQGAGIMAGIANGAKQGLFQSLLQPVTDKGNFLWHKSMQSAIGTSVGGALGGALAALKPAFSWGANLIRKMGGGEEAAQAAADQVTDTTLKAAGVDPAKMDPNLYSSIRQEVGDAIKAGVDPDPKVMVNRADADALPVPMRLTRGMASGDAMQYSWEQNTSKLRGVGEPLNDRLTELNRAAIENLNVLGARKAPSTFDASQTLIKHIENLDASLKGRVDAAYQAVRDSAGRPALMDREAFQTTARNSLEQAQLTEFVPETIKKQYNALAAGQLPLTVDTAQTLDKVWSAEQRAAQGSAKEAIGKLRDALNQAPVSDALGTESMQAYKAARELARQRFALIESNPAYKAVLDGAEPDKFFQKYVQGADVADLGKLKELIGPDNTRVLQRTFLGNLKRIALNGSSDERGAFSQSAFNNVLQDPVQGPRIAELFKDTPQTLDHLYRLGRTAENVWKFPVGHGVNTSNTASAAANIIRDVAKSEAGGLLWNLVPGGRVLRHLSEQVSEKGAARKAVDEALNPGVTTSALKPAAPSAQVRRLSDLIARGGAAAAASQTQE